MRLRVYEMGISYRGRMYTFIGVRQTSSEKSAVDSMPSQPDASPQTNSQIPSRVNVALALLLWTYTAVRAARLSFTHDESLTYLRAVRNPVARILAFEVGMPSNNHLLNSLLAKLSALISESPFALRLPNVLAHGLYLAAALLLARHVAAGYARVLALVILTLNPFLLDFFSLCRGYGLACGFEMMALYLLVKSSDAPDVRPMRSLAASLLAAFSPLANLSFLVFFLAFSATICLLDLAKWALPRIRSADPKPSNARVVGALVLQLALAGLLCAFVVPIGLRLKEMGELYYGGDVGLLADTAASLLEATTYYRPYPDALRVALQVLSVALAACVLGLAAHAAWKRLPRAAWVCFVPLLTAAICLVQNRVLGTKFPVDRTALFFVPMLALALVVAAASAERRHLSYALLGAGALLLSVNAARTLNFRYFAQWKYDASTKQMLARLSEIKRGRRTRLGVNWLFEPTINYYREVNDLSWLARVDRSGVDGEFDYYFYLPEDQQAMASHPVRIVRKFKTSRATLAKRLR